MQFPIANQVVNPGDKVVWKNTDLVPHTVTAEDGSFDSKQIDPGKTWEYRFTKNGTIAYKCLYHPNMHGSVTVKGK